MINLTYISDFRDCTNKYIYWCNHDLKGIMESITDVNKEQIHTSSYFGGLNERAHILQ